MQSLFENWRKYNTIHKKINTLESGKRFVSDVLTEVSEEDGKIKLSPEELDRVREWGGLRGEPDFLGSGSKGVSYKFGDKVLKLTRDESEVQACAAILNQYSPNVYDVFNVGRLPEGYGYPYAIIYGYLDYPNTAMVDVTEVMFHKIKKSDIYYHWQLGFLDVAEKLIKELVTASDEDPSILGEPLGMYASIQPKIDDIAENLGWTKEEKTLFTEFWTIGIGMYNSSLDNPLSVYENARKVLADPRTLYFHQLALGLTFLFNHGVKFSDLKTSNIMEKDGQIAIIDIGYSKVSQRYDIPPI